MTTLAVEDRGTNIAFASAMSNHHVAVWIDHHEAKIFHVDDANVEATEVRAPEHHVRRHANETTEKNHPADAQHFYHDVVRALEGAERILVVGPATAKLEFIKHVHKHDHTLVSKIVGVETIDHPSDGQLVKYFRSYFRASDRMQ